MIGASSKCFEKRSGSIVADGDDDLEVGSLGISHLR
jgi:hypothetical protein